MVEVPGGSGYSFQYRHLAYVEYEEAAEAQKALKVSLWLGKKHCITWDSF